ncbi:CinA family protein [Demequina capsici]|uniref:CinA family protein n=1 Tax=Demequina capsici TaxID=3075620 RepID=A0AA96FAB4_9MICO|nr:MULTISPECIES: CinA family protein [unclassified Demequina]WNM23380.1 CinA family protein [Demequina sp. OYTSA14]WNM26257.1 CinA family protein [Demequina sp. PMTSA13]
MTSAQDVIAAARAAELSVAVAESLTGGAVCSALVSVPGASHAFVGGVVSYSLSAKHTLLGVPDELLETVGPVSRDVAVAMAEGVRTRLGADVAVSTTGVAGPEPHDGQPPGTVWVGIATARGSDARMHVVAGDREAVRDAAVSWALAAAAQALVEVSHA